MDSEFRDLYYDPDLLLPKNLGKLEFSDIKRLDHLKSKHDPERGFFMMAVVSTDESVKHLAPQIKNHKDVYAILAWYTLKNQAAPTFPVLASGISKSLLNTHYNLIMNIVADNFHYMTPSMMLKYVKGKEEKVSDVTRLDPITVVINHGMEYWVGNLIVQRQ